MNVEKASNWNILNGIYYGYHSLMDTVFYLSN